MPLRNFSSGSVIKPAKNNPKDHAAIGTNIKIKIAKNITKTKMKSVNELMSNLKTNATEFKTIVTELLRD